MRPERTHVVSDQFLELDRLPLRPILRAFQQAPTRMFQDLLVTGVFDSPRFLATNLVDGLVHLLHHVESIQHMDRLAKFFANDLEIRLPHVAAHEVDAGPRLVGQELKESPQARLGSLRADPQQPLHAVFDLIDQRQILVPAAPLDFIDADGLDAAHVAMHYSSKYRVFYRTKHVIPGGVKHVGHLLPRQPLRPPSQEPAVARRQMALAISPGNLFDHDAPRRATDPPHRVEKEHRDGPQAHVLETADRQTIVARTDLLAARTDRPPVGSRVDRDLDGQFAVGLDHSGLAVHE